MFANRTNQDRIFQSFENKFITLILARGVLKNIFSE